MAKVVPLRCGGASGLVSRLELFMQIQKMLMFILRTLNGRKILFLMVQNLRLFIKRCISKLLFLRQEAAEINLHLSWSLPWLVILPREGGHWTLGSSWPGFYALGKIFHYLFASKWNERNITSYTSEPSCQLPQSFYWFYTKNWQHS